MADASDEIPTNLKELLHYQRLGDARRYCLRVTTPRLELWRVTELEGEAPTAVKEADLRSADEALELLDDIKRSLRADGWREA